MTAELETEKLILRPLELADAEETQRLFPHWEIVRYLSAKVPWPYPEDGALAYFRDVALPAIAGGEEWHWTLRLRESPERQIGMIGLFRGQAKNRGFWLGSAWQGHGLMLEAVIAVTDFWFDVLGFEVLRAPKAVANVASRRISERTGMRLVATEEHDFVGGRMPAEVWEISREEWSARRALLAAERRSM